MSTAPTSNLQPDSNSPEPTPKPRKKRRTAKVALVLLLCGAGLTYYAFYTKNGQRYTVPAKKWIPIALKAKQDPDLLFKSVGTPDDRVNILLIGPDRNWKPGQVFDPTVGKFRPHHVENKDERPRSDTMIVASFDRKARQVRLISLPRDSRVRYLDFDGHKHKADKLNAVYAQPDGEKLLPKVFQDELGIRIDRVAEIKLDGFTKLVDAVGGLDINVEGALFDGKRTRMKYEDHWGGWKVDLMPGMQHLDGEQAHGYVRYRLDNEGDPGRVRRQQQVLRELAKQLRHLAPWKVPETITAAQKLLQTNLSDEELASAAFFARGLASAGSIAPLTPYGVYARNGDIILNKPQNDKLFAAIFGPSFNPGNFLKLSPTTQRDDIGARNNNNPSALSVLRDAGLAKDNSRHNAKIEAPGLQ